MRSRQVSTSQTLRRRPRLDTQRSTVTDRWRHGKPCNVPRWRDRASHGPPTHSLPSGRQGLADIAAPLSDQGSLLAFGRTPAVVTKVSLWRLVEVDLCEPKHLLPVDMVDVDTNVSHQLRGDILAMLLDVRHPVV